MVRLGAGLLLAVVTTASAFGQSPTRVEIRQGRSRAAVEPAGTEPYAGGPWASVPAAALRSDSPISIDAFRIRAWVESGKTRVVVFAVRRESPTRESETQIATVLLVSGEARDVVETERYGASHVLVSVEPGQ